MENKEFLTKQIITYLGNKRKLLSFIEQDILKIKSKLDKKKLILFDGFSGSGIVARMMKQHSDVLITNDWEPYSFIINECYLSNKSDVDFNKIYNIYNSLNERIPDYINGDGGFIRELYAPKSEDDIKKEDRCFFTIDNAKILDGVRQDIDLIEEEFKKYFLGPLLSEISVHANTSGVFKGFYKNKNGIGQYGGENKNCLNRIMGQIRIQGPRFSNFECEVKNYNDDINNTIKNLDDIDVVYYDPPYNQHPYGSNYFMLNLFLGYKRPTEISKVSGIPTGWKKSDYNKKDKAIESFDNLIKNTMSKYILLSYNNEGILSVKEISDIIKKYGKFTINDREYNTFKGSRNLKNRSIKTKELLWFIEKK